MSAGQLTQGRRIYPGENGGFENTQPGDYGFIEGGGWYVRLPTWTDERIGLRHMVSIEGHSVVEHEDKTITVSPSLLWDKSCQPTLPESWWHGMLERGVWREV